MVAYRLAATVEQCTTIAAQQLTTTCTHINQLVKATAGLSGSGMKVAD